MVLYDVPDDAIAVKVTTTALGAEILLEGDLHIAYVMPIPPCSKNGVGPPQHEKILQQESPASLLIGRLIQWRGFLKKLQAERERVIRVFVCYKYMRCPWNTDKGQWFRVQICWGFCPTHSMSAHQSIGLLCWH
jgi:hypothetical protein